MNDDSDLANLFAAFSHPKRISVLRALLPFGTTGQTFGALSKGLSLSPSTLTHHLR